MYVYVCMYVCMYVYTYYVYIYIYIYIYVSPYTYLFIYPGPLPRPPLPAARRPRRGLPPTTRGPRPPPPGAYSIVYSNSIITVYSISYIVWYNCNYTYQSSRLCRLLLKGRGRGAAIRGLVGPGVVLEERLHEDSVLYYIMLIMCYINLYNIISTNIIINILSCNIT